MLAIKEIEEDNMETVIICNGGVCPCGGTFLLIEELQKAFDRIKCVCTNCDAIEVRDNPLVKRN